MTWWLSFHLISPSPNSQGVYQSVCDNVVGERMAHVCVCVCNISKVWGYSSPRTWCWPDTWCGIRLHFGQVPLFASLRMTSFPTSVGQSPRSSSSSGFGNMNFRKEGMSDSRIQGSWTCVRDLVAQFLNRDLLGDHAVLPGVVVFEGIPKFIHQMDLE